MQQKHFLPIGLQCKITRLTVSSGVGNLYARQSTQTYLSEEKQAEAFDAAVVDVDDDCFAVTVQRTRFTADATHSGGETTLRFGEETDVDEFTVPFCDAAVTELLPDAWTVIAEAKAAQTPVEAAVTAPGPAVPRQQEPGGHLSPDMELSERVSPVAPRGRQPPVHAVQEVYSGGVREAVEVEERPGQDDRRDRLQAAGPPVEPGATVPVERDTGPEPAASQEPLYGRAEPSVNAATVVEQLFRYTELDGTLEAVSDYGVTEDFDRDAGSAYWIDIEGMDMARTEYFINGELADDSIDSYSLGPTDTITFVQSPVFAADGEDGAYCGGQSADDTLRLSDINEIEDVEQYSLGRDVPTPALTAPSSYVPAS